MAEKLSYKTTVLKTYRLTPHQLEQAIEQGLVRCRKVKNPHHRSGPPSLLINVEDIEANLELIRGFPKYTKEELARRRYYAARKKLRDSLEFFCPRCKAKVRPRRDSLSFESLWEGFLSPEDAREAIIIAHYRHAHTAYDKDRKKVEKWLTKEDVEEVTDGKFKSYNALLDSLDWAERDGILWDWLETLKEEAAARAKAFYTQKARQLAVKDGLLAPDEDWLEEEQ